MNDALVQHVAALIAQYLQRRPAAADTVEGVHYFWVGAQGEELPLDIAQAALDLLLARGEVARVPIGNRVLWRAPRERA